MRFLRAAFALVALLALFLVPSAADAAAGLEVHVYGVNRQTARSALNVTTNAKEKVSAVTVELTIDGRPVRLDGYENPTSSSNSTWPFVQNWTNGVEVDRPLAETQAKVSVTYESGETVVVERPLLTWIAVQISELAYTPTDLGESHGPVTFTGLVTYKKNATETLPAPGAKVRVFSDGYNSTTVSTGEDGRFTLTTYMHKSGRPRVFVENERPYAGMFVNGETPIKLADAKTRISWSAPGQDNIWVGDSVDISGLLEWRTAAGEWLPLAEARYVQVKCSEKTAYASTKRDGTFRMTFIPERPCRLAVMFSATDTMFQFAGGNPIPMVRQRAALTGLTWPKSPVVQGVPFSLKGTYVGLPGNTPLADGTAELFYSPDNKSWERVGAHASPDADGVVTMTRHAWAEGYWKLEMDRFGTEPVILTSPLIKVRKRADLTSFDAAPEPVRKGRKLTVYGALSNSYTTEPMRKQKVVLWFRPKGSKTWKKLAALTTGTDGGFSKTFKATRDGSWRATYAGDAVYFATTSASDYVDVR